MINKIYRINQIFIKLVTMSKGLKQPYNSFKNVMLKSLLLISRVYKKYLQIFKKYGK